MYYAVQICAATRMATMQQQTADYKWNGADLVGKGAYGRVYKVIFSFNVEKNAQFSYVNQCEIIFYKYSFIFYLSYKKGNEMTTGKEVAIKVFSGFTLEMYINREAETLKRCQHENIVQFLALQDVDHVLYRKDVIIMEYCARGNLLDFIDSQPNGLKSSQFLRMCDNLISAIKHLHEKSLVHRDIKPQNILISCSDDGTNIYKLADFGAARVLMPNQTYGSLYGTFEYIHPDIFAKFYAHALDVIPPQHFNNTHELWSIGVLLYEAASGMLPFEPKNGRDPKTMYRMLSKKQINQISAKEEEEGIIVWSTELPDNCAINEKIKREITPFLAHLISPVNLSFESFFHEAKAFLASAQDASTQNEKKKSNEKEMPVENRTVLQPRTNEQTEKKVQIKKAKRLRGKKQKENRVTKKKTKPMQRACKNNWWRISSKYKAFHYFYSSITTNKINLHIFVKYCTKQNRNVSI